MFAPESEENFLWTNSALNSAESARAYYASDDWQNSGGDRTWLAPELDFFFPKFPDIDICRLLAAAGPRSRQLSAIEDESGLATYEPSQHPGISIQEKSGVGDHQISRLCAESIAQRRAGSGRFGPICRAHAADFFKDPRFKSR